MYLEVSGSSEQLKEEEATPPATVEVQSKVSKEQSPSNVLVGDLSELAP